MSVLKKTKKLVLKILDQYPETREDDKLLLLKVWEAKGFYLTPEQARVFPYLPHFESIRRNRQSIQAKGYFPPSLAVQIKRKQTQIKWKQELKVPKFYFDKDRQVYVQI